MKRLENCILVKMVRVQIKWLYTNIIMIININHHSTHNFKIPHKVILYNPNNRIKWYIKYHNLFIIPFPVAGGIVLLGEFVSSMNLENHTKESEWPSGLQTMTWHYNKWVKLQEPLACYVMIIMLFIVQRRSACVRLKMHWTVLKAKCNNMLMEYMEKAEH